MSATEHILMESDVREVPNIRSARKVHARTRLKSRLRRRVVQLEIIDYYYLAVRTWRAGTLLAEYVLDLRFVEAAPRTSRYIAWRWLTTAFALITVAAVIAVCGGLSGSGPWRYVSIVTAMAGAVAALICAYGTHETMTLYSANGRAKWLEFRGGIGTLRAARQVMMKVAAHTRLAAAARRESKAAHLRDEMREHFRLRETGIIAADEYEAAKIRILGQHDPQGVASESEPRRRAAGS